jgi:DNA-binding MarR family transcriptional regulator
MFDLLMRTAPQRTRILGEHGLTPNDARGLSSLDLQNGQSMRSLAQAWSCDASNATFIVDRLERMGLAERRTIPEDRRVKLVALTRKGLKLRSELLKQFYDPPAEFFGLNTSQLETLHRILRQIIKEPELQS